MVRQAATDFFGKSWIVPAKQLQEELKVQRELKKKTCSLAVDRTAPPSTAVGLWVSSGVLEQLDASTKVKDQKKAKKAAVKEQTINKKASRRVELLRLGEEALKKLSSEPVSKGEGTRAA